MKNYSVFIAESAQSELNAAFLWYEEQKEGLGLEFLSEIDRIIEKISMMPASFEIVYRHFRRVMTDVFPYHIYYEILGEVSEVEILVVIHTSQNPKTPHKRLKTKRK